MRAGCGAVRGARRCGGPPGATSGRAAGPPTHGRGRFLGCGIRATAGGGEDGKGEHDERDVAVPAVPGAGLVVVEAEFGLRGLESVLDSPPVALDGDEGLDRGAGRAPGGEV